jgi:hypothetical protein
MWKSMCRFKFSPKEIEYSNKDNENLKIFMNVFMFTLYFWISTKHNLNFFFAFVDLLLKLSNSKQLYNWKKLLYYFTTRKIMWGWPQEYHFHWHDTHLRLLLISLVLLYLFVFLIQNKGHWLLNDALNFVISMSLKFKDKINFTPFGNLMKENANVVFEL